jgi:hypothetical protein
VVGLQSWEIGWYLDIDFALLVSKRMTIDPKE